MKTIELSKKQIYCGNLLLVNAQYPLKNDNADDLAPVDIRFPDVLVKREVANVLQLIFEKISSGNFIVPVSGFRSEQEQAAIYDDSLKDNGKAFTRKYVALPNHSEHQTGLAIDLGLYSDHIDFIRPDFPYDGICEMFREAAPSYGFVERYPAGKEKITGIAHEPWHFRYVGFPHSAIMADMELALEEYVELIKNYTLEHPLLYKGTEIYYVPANGKSTEIRLLEKSIYQISGNNVDGFVVTLWRKSQ